MQGTPPVGSADHATRNQLKLNPERVQPQDRVPLTIASVKIQPDMVR